MDVDPAPRRAAREDPFGHRKLRWNRIQRRIYSFGPAELQLLEELARLFPDQPPLLDFDKLVAGTESIETLSQKLYQRLFQTPDRKVFMVFCRLNGHRFQDYVAHLIDEDALPFEVEEIVAEVYARLFHFVRVGYSLYLGERSESFVRELPEHRTLYEMLAFAAEDLLEENVEALAGTELPLPGLPLPEFSPFPATLQRAEEFVRAQQCRVSADTMAHWTVFSLLQMSREDRRLLYWRDRHEESLETIAGRLDISAFQVGKQVQEAHLKLKEHLDRIIRTFLHRENPEGELDEAD